MDIQSFIALENIKRFNERLKREPDGSAKEVIKQLRAAEEVKLRQLKRPPLR